MQKNRRSSDSNNQDSGDKTERRTHRFVSRDGSVNIKREGLSRKQPIDWYYMLINLELTRLLLIIGAYFILINAVFAALYMSDSTGMKSTNPYDFFDLFFFSVHVFTTLGFDQLRPQSFYTNLLVSIDAFAGWCSFGLIAGLLFSRFSRPSARIVFTQHAIVTNFEGLPTFAFRAANRRGKQILQAHIRVTLSRSEKTLEGENIRRVYDLKLLRDSCSFFNLTWTLRHCIDKNSPLYEQTPESLKESETEITVLLSGIDEIFGQTVHSHFAYNHEEILFGHRFASLFDHDEQGLPLINFSKFDVLEKHQPSEK